jgi:hypothetical protein
MSLFEMQIFLSIISFCLKNKISSSALFECDVLYSFLPAHGYPTRHWGWESDTAIPMAIQFDVSYVHLSILCQVRCWLWFELIRPIIQPRLSQQILPRHSSHHRLLLHAHERSTPHKNVPGPNYPLVPKKHLHRHRPRSSHTSTMYQL